MKEGVAGHPPPLDHPPPSLHSSRPSPLALQHLVAAKQGPELLPSCSCPAEESGLNSSAGPQVLVQDLQCTQIRSRGREMWDRSLFLVISIEVKLKTVGSDEVT